MAAGSRTGTRRCVQRLQRLRSEADAARRISGRVRVETAGKDAVAPVADRAELHRIDLAVLDRIDVAAPVLELLVLEGALDKEVGVTRAKEGMQRVQVVHLPV